TLRSTRSPPALSSSSHRCSRIHLSLRRERHPVAFSDAPLQSRISALEVEWTGSDSCRTHLLNVHIFLYLHYSGAATAQLFSSRGRASARCYKMADADSGNASSPSTGVDRRGAPHLYELDGLLQRTLSLRRGHAHAHIADLQHETYK